jgi:methyl-accepting chemotaxis protein
MKLKNTFTSLLAGMLLLTVLPSLIIGMVITRSFITKLVMDDMPATLAATRADIQTEIARGWEASLSLSRNPSLREWFIGAETDEEAGRMSRDIMLELASRKGFATAFAANALTGRYWVKDELMDVLSKDDPDDSWFFGTLGSTNELQLNLDYNEKMQTTNLWFNALVKDRDKTIGIAGIGISVDEVIAKFRTSAPSQRARVFLVDQGNTILVSSLENVTNKPLSEYVPGKLSATDKAELKSYRDPAFGTMFYIEGAISNTPYRVVITAPESDFLPGFIALCGLPLLYAAIIAGFATLLGSIAIGRTVVRPLKQLATASERIASGDADVQLDVSANNEIGILARSFNSMAESIKEQALSSGKIADGDLTTEFRERSENDILAKSMNGVIANIRNLVTETTRLTETSVNGDLSARGDAGRFTGGFRDIVNGMNCTLDAITAPIRETSVILGKIAEGDLGARVTGDYKGDHARIRDDLNAMAEKLQDHIEEIAKTLDALSTGDLNREIVGDYRGDFTRIKQSLNLIVGALNDVIGNFGESAEQVSAGAQQISETSQTLAQGATEQGETLDRIVVEVSELEKKTRLNTLNADRAKELADTAKTWADKGNKRMSDMARAMKAIDDSSADISRVIAVIDDIAFHTNILALNAAVEAARAGKHGKGFAIVADEVRNLAVKSADAAKETMILIETSLRNVDAGSKVTGDAVAALNGIVESVDGTANAIASIENASNEQARSITNVSAGLSRVMQVAQANTATSEESAAASEELSGQAQILKEAVGNFTLSKKREGGAHESAPRAPQIAPAPKRRNPSLAPESLAGIEI